MNWYVPLGLDFFTPTTQRILISVLGQAGSLHSLSLSLLCEIITSSMYLVLIVLSSLQLYELGNIKTHGPSPRPIPPNPPQLYLHPGQHLQQPSYLLQVLSALNTVRMWERKIFTHCW